jgi:endonuclease VIII
MPEGPSLVIAREELSPFIGKKILSVSGSSKINQERLAGQKILDIRTWGKHLLFVFKGFSIRVHFLMFGTYHINSQKDAIPRLHLEFKAGEINLYTCAIKDVDLPLDEVYDWKADVLGEEWDSAHARKKLKKIPDTLVTDALLNQEIFSGVGNIIKNEVLYRIKVHPLSTIGSLPPRKLGELIREAVHYSYDFLEWKRAFVLKQHWLAHTKKICKRDGGKIVKEYLGKTGRRTFFCNACQVLYK